MRQLCKMYSHEEYDEADWQQLQLLLHLHDHQRGQNKHKVSMWLDLYALGMTAVSQSFV